MVSAKGAAIELKGRNAMAIVAERPSGTQKSRPHVAALRARLREAEDTISALRSGAADAVIGSNNSQPSVLTLKGADHPYRLIVEMMGEGSVTLASDGTILYCNDRFAEMVKRTHQQLIGFSV